MPRRRVDPVPDGPHVGALDVLTEIPTPSGLTTLEHLEVGDTVFGSSGRPVTVAEISEPVRGSACFEVEFSTGDRVIADEEQRWLTERRDVPRSALVPTRRDTLQVAGSVAELGPTVLGIKVAPPVHLPARRLTLDPYLLGAWLALGVEGGTALVGASDALVQRLREIGVRVFATGIAGQYWIAVPVGTRRRAIDLHARLRALDLLDDKHVPMAYLRAGEQQRRGLLAGLLDAAGEISDGGEIVFRTSGGYSVTAGVFELLASLGYRPSLRRGPGGAAEIGFVTAERVFGVEALHQLHQGRRRLAADLRPRRLVVGVRRVRSRPVRQLQVFADDGVVLVGRSFIPMPGATLAPVARISSPA